MGISLEQALKRCDLRGERALPFLCRWAPFRAFQRLIGIMGRAVNQSSGGF